jgi:hypothetical protein
MEIELINLISNVGFPIAITCWFVLRLENVIKNNTAALIRVEKVLEDKK